MGKLKELIHDFSENWNDMKNSIEAHTGVLTAVGIGVSLLGTVFACKATLKVNKEAEDHTKLIQDTKANCAEAQTDNRKKHIERRKRRPQCRQGCFHNRKEKQKSSQERFKSHPGNKTMQKMSFYILLELIRFYLHKR